MVSFFSQFLELRRNWALKILQAKSGGSLIKNGRSYNLCAFLGGKICVVSRVFIILLEFFYVGLPPAPSSKRGSQKGE